MRILTRYILREVISHALLGLVLFTFVLFTSRLGQIFEILVRNSASVGQVGRLILSFLPETLVVTIPMAILVGILLGLSRLAADSEITAMRAAGMGVYEFVRIVSLVALGALALSLLNSLYLAPRSAAALLRLEDSLKYAQASFEVQPRVFDEDFKNLVLYVQDVRPGAGAALWRHVFLADVTDPATPRVTTAEQALVTSDSPGELHLTLENGGQHQISSTNPDQYNISTFGITSLPLLTNGTEDAHLSRSNTPILALPLRELIRRAREDEGTGSAARALSLRYRIELNKRFSYPFACLVLMLVGVPLGLSSKRGGKSTGFVLTILLVFVYYFLSSVGVALATQGKVPPFAGVWAANGIFALAGLLLLQQMARGGVALSVFSAAGVALGNLLQKVRPNSKPHEQPILSQQMTQRMRSLLHIRFPLILDDYITREFASSFALILSSFSALFLIFTFFELIGDIIRNRTPLVTVGDYLVNLVPYILYNVTPLCVLVAVLVTFGALARSSEYTAMKAAGISLYRIVTPVIVLAAVIGVALFAFDETYLPAANRRQESLRAEIKGRPAQTFLRPDRQWISGQTFAQQTRGTRSLLRRGGATDAAEPGTGVAAPAPNPASSEPARIFYYQFFDADRDQFRNLTVFEFDPNTYTLTRRIFAGAAHWNSQAGEWTFDDGWVRTFTGETVAGFSSFREQSFPEIHERPGYFKKEDRPSQEMSFGELSHYISDLRQSGFDTKRLTVQLNRKLAYPLITLVMAILAVPFAIVSSKRSGVTGFAVAILLAVLYLGVSSLFEAMGNVNTLPATLAAWAPDALFGLAGAWLLLRMPT